jgi:cysteine desulfurase / selenocysteine lyase
MQAIAPPGITPREDTGVPSFEQLRKDFPALNRTVNGKRLAYLDSTNATLKPLRVIEALTDFYTNRPANVHRGIHLLSEEASEAYELAREKVARFIGARRTEEVAFTRNTTEAINLVAHALERRLKPGDEILCTAMEHHANIIPWQVVRDRTGCTLRFADVTPQGRLDMDDWHAKLSARTKMVTFAHVSNVLGVENPVKVLTAAAHSVGALVLLDTAQGAPHLPINVAGLGVDFAACSGYKMLGPFGIGALWGRYELLKEFPPYQTGGSMIYSVTLEKTEYAEPPTRFEAGTPSIGDAIAWGVALDYLGEIGMQRIAAHESTLSRYLHDKLLEVPGLRILGEYYPGKPGIASFTLDYAHPHDISQFLNEDGVAVRAGHHCAEPLHIAMGVQSSVRASLYMYNIEEDVDQLVSSLHGIRELFA